MSTTDERPFPPRTRPPMPRRAELYVVGVALLLIGIGGFVLLMATTASSAVLENRGTVYACAKDGGRITALRWDGPPRCRNGEVVTWSARSEVDPTTTTTGSTTTTHPDVADSVTRPFPTWTVTTP